MAKIYLGLGEVFNLGSYSVGDIVGQAGVERVLISPGATATTDQNVERVEFPGASNAYTFTISGNQITVLSGTTIVETFSAGGSNQVLAFSDGSAIVNMTALNAATLGGAAIPTIAAAVVPMTLNTADKSSIFGTTPNSTPITATAFTPVSPATFSISADAASANEGDNATFTVNLSAAQSTATTVSYTLIGTGGTVLAVDTGAASVSGGIAAGTSITFPAGVTTAKITVPIILDNIAETGKGISVTLSSPSTGSSLGTATASTLTPDVPSTTVNLTSQAALFNNVQSGTGAIAKLTDAYMNTLDWGFHWNTTNLSYEFNTVIPNEYLSNTSLTDNWSAFNASEKSVAQAALQRVSELIPLVFTQVEGTTGDIRFNSVDISDASGFAYAPSDGIGGDVWIGSSNRIEANAYQPGSYGQLVIIHEIGHALGLKHTFDAPSVLPTNLDDSVHSVMSYTSYKYLTPSFTYDSSKVYFHGNSVYQTEYSLFDVEALQAIYGANTGFHTGVDTYTVGANQYRTLWDAGGTDTIDESDATGTCTVNLCPGQYSSLNVQTLAQQQAATLAYYHAAGKTGSSIDSFVASIYSGSNAVNFYTGENNLAIASGAWIENVSTGSANDIVVDNAVNNTIIAGGGDDLVQLYWGGFDTVNGGTGTDTVQVLDKQSQAALVKQSDGSYLMVGTYFAAVLIGIEQVQFSDVFQSLTA